MTDGERDQRIETLTDAIAETNRNLGHRIEQLAIEVAENSRTVTALLAVAAITNGNVNTLTELVHLHLHVDHDYPDLDDDDGGQS